MTKYSKLYQAGFTLVELMVAMTIVAILAGVILHPAAAALRNGRDAQRRTDLAKIKSALNQYYVDHNFYPSSVAWATLGTSLQRSMQIDTITPTGLNNCNGVPGPCAVTRVYLQRLPYEPLNTNSGYPSYLHYCYQAYTSKAEFDSGAIGPGQASTCDNRTSNDSCHYFRLYASQEIPSGNPVMHCNDGSGDHFSAVHNYSDYVLDSL